MHGPSKMDKIREEKSKAKSKEVVLISFWYETNFIDEWNHKKQLKLEPTELHYISPIGYKGRKGVRVEEC